MSRCATSHGSAAFLSRRLLQMEAHVHVAVHRRVGRVLPLACKAIDRRRMTQCQEQLGAGLSYKFPECWRARSIDHPMGIGEPDLGTAAPRGCNSVVSGYQSLTLK